jgi:hypothetical protein
MILEAIWEIFKWAMFLLGCFTAFSAVALLTFIWMQARD